MYCATWGTSSTRRRRVWSLDDIGPSVASERGRASCPVVPSPAVAGDQLELETDVLGHRRQLVRADQAERVTPDPADRRPARLPLLEDRGQVDDRGRRVVARGRDLGDLVAGLRIDPLVFEDQPAVEPGEVVRFGQPDVDRSEAAGREIEQARDRDAAFEARLARAQRAPAP